MRENNHRKVSGKLKSKKWKTGGKPSKHLRKVSKRKSGKTPQTKQKARELQNRKRAGKPPKLKI